MGGSRPVNITMAAGSTSSGRWNPETPPVELGSGFAVHLCHKSAPSLEEFKGLPLVQLEFTATSVPRRLDEPEAD